MSYVTGKSWAAEVLIVIAVALIVISVGYLIWQQETAAMKECAPNCTMLVGADLNVLDQHIPIEYKCVSCDPANMTMHDRILEDSKRGR